MPRLRSGKWKSVRNQLGAVMDGPLCRAVGYRAADNNTRPVFDFALVLCTENQQPTTIRAPLSAANFLHRVGIDEILGTN